MAKTYWEKLKDPRWQKKRLEALQKADFHCEYCMDGSTTLHVHHKEYFKGREPWEYEVDQLAVLCENCHAEQHETDDVLKLVCSRLPVMGPHSREDAAALLAGWAGIQDPDLADNHFAFLSGDLANLFDGFRPGCRININDLLLISQVAADFPGEMLAAMLAFAKSIHEGTAP